MKNYMIGTFLILSMVLPASFSSALTTTYTYDAAGRLTRADYDIDASITYAYDVNGNLVQRTVDPPEAAEVAVNLNQSSYQEGDIFQFGLTVNGYTTSDIYAAIFFPNGDFITIKHPLNFSLPGVIEPYKTGLVNNGETNYSIMNFALPKIPKGSYFCLGMICKPNTDPYKVENWIFYDFKSFEMK